MTNYTAGGTNWTAHIFTTVGTTSLTVQVGGNCEVVVVGGGGGGGMHVGGGGGGGGVVYATSYNLTASPALKTIVVGDGGPGAFQTYDNPGANGSNSVFDVSGGSGYTITAFGGGGGAGYYVGGGSADITNGVAGGSGGGGGVATASANKYGYGGLATTGSWSGVAGAIGYGNAGGRSYNGPQYGGGGGGGSDGVGATSTGGEGGNGGIGVNLPAFSNLVPSTVGTIHNGWFGGGGGGGCGAQTPGAGGKGGGGEGSAGGPVAGTPASNNGTNGLANTGGGGGGGNQDYSGSPEAYGGGKGGSGIVIVRYVEVVDTSSPVIANLAATNVTATSAYLNGSLTSTGTSATAVWVYWGGTDQTTNANLWAYTNYFGNGLTNGTYTTNTSYTTSLAKGATYYYNFFAQNASTGVWATTAGSESFTTDTNPTVTVSAATGIGVGTATLNGTLTSDGGDATTVYLAWGTNDFGTASTSAWPNVVGFGTKTAGQSVSNNLSGLIYGLSYWYRVFATNATGDAWSSPTNFVTAAPTVGSAGGLPVTNGLVLHVASDDVDGDGDTDDNPAHNATVSQWSDKSGGGNHFDQVTSTPLYKTDALNGIGVIEFDGNDDKLQTTRNFRSPSITDHTVMLVARWVEGGNHGRLLSCGTGNWLFGYHGNQDQAWYFEGGPYGRGNLTYTWHYHAATVSSDDKVNFWMDGSQIDTDNNGAGSPYEPPTLALGNNTHNQASHCQVAEVVIFDRMLDPAELNDVGGYLQWKYDFSMGYPAYTPPAAGSAFGISNATATAVQATQATLNGTLTGSNVYFDVWAYWGPTDGTNDPAAWTNSALVGGYTLTGATTSSNIAYTAATGIAVDNGYWYTLCASNAATNIWATPSKAFITAEVTAQATAAQAWEKGALGAPIPGTVTVSRAASATNVELAVTYSITGTASNGTDYTLLSGTVTLGAGATNADIVISPWNDFTVEGDEEAVITLLSGPYRIGAANSATVTVVDTVLTPYYVSTNGTQTAPYDDWTNAFNNLQSALDYAGAKVSAILYLAGGQSFDNAGGGAEAASVFLWQGATNVNLSGGWATNAAPPDTQSSATIVKRASTAGSRRVMRMSGVSNAVIEQVTIRDGYNNVGYNDVRGLGVYLTNCRDVTLADCVISNNVSTQARVYGGGMYLSGSSATLTNTTIANNQLTGNWDDGFKGGGIRIDGTSRMTATRCVLRKNRADGSSWWSGGGGFWVDGGGTLNLIETVLDGNENLSTQGAIGGGAGVNYGTLRMQNCLVVNNKDARNTGDGIELRGGSASFVNCTIVANNNVAILYVSGSVAMTNCIVSGHTTADLVSVPLANVWYSSIGDGQNDGVQGCFTLDPLFVDTTYYHLQSTTNHYTGGYFSGGSWAQSASSSPLLDLGDSASDYGREPAPNGSRINMGAYGNTEVASQTPFVVVTQPSVTNHGAALVGHRTAVLRAEVTDTGGQNPDCRLLYWESGSGVTNTIAAGMQLGYFERDATGLTPGTPYEYLVTASNSAGTAQSAVATFSTHPTPSYLYVSTNGNDTAGTNWVTAYSEVQTALDLAEAGDTIYLAGHTFVGGISGTLPAHPYNAFLVWQNATNIALRGGYDALAGGGSDPGARSSATTVRRTVGNVRVLAMIGATNCTVERVTFREGLNSLNSAYTINGAGVYLSNCEGVTFSDCTVTGNSNSGSGYGTGMGLTGSSVVLTNCTISDNYENAERSGGTGIAVDGSSSLTAIRSFILRNKGNNAGGNGNQGMGFLNAGVLTLIETVVSGNEAQNFSNAASVGGGVNSGTLTMLNCLVTSNRTYAGTSADGIHLSGGSASIVNCTIVSNYARGIWYVGGTVGITNCIAWGHTTADLASVPLANVWYSSIGDGQNNGVQGCYTPASPLFADTTYYHLQSTVSNYSGAYFTGGSWATSAANSPLIDKGDTNSAFGREPVPNGSRINMGAYGNTEVASMTLDVVATLPAVTNPGAIEWGHRTAVLRGEVTDEGGETPQCSFLYWPSSGGSTSIVAKGEQAGTFESTVTNLTPGASYEYKVEAYNSAGTGVSAVASFTMHPTPSYLYVATNGNDTAGTNWVTAYPDVQTALDLAETGDTIYLAGHTFAGGIGGTLPAHPANAFLIWQNATNITIRGGYDAVAGGGSDPGTRNAVTEWKRTVGGVRVLTMSGVTNCTVEQVTIRDGIPTAVGGLGVYLTNCWDVTFASCVITNNGGNLGGITGIGMYLQGSSMVLTNTTITRCYSVGQTWYVYGGGVYLDSLSRMTAVRSTFAGNSMIESVGNGSTGPAFASAGTVDLFECVLSGNEGGSATHGGAIYNSGTLRMRDCLVVSNKCLRADSAAGIHLGGGSAAMVNCTIADNYARGIQYGGGTVGMTNCIVWGHSNADLNNFAGQLANVGYSLFAVPNQHGVNNCITNDPLFVGAATNDYRLLTRPIPSPAIDAGFKELSGWMLGAVDLAGDSRRQGGSIDMGAYEAASRTGTLFLLR